MGKSALIKGIIKRFGEFPYHHIPSTAVGSLSPCWLSRFSSTQQTVKKFLALTQRFRLPVFLADTAALALLSQDALRQRDRQVREPHCSFLCTGRPVTSFALQANLWKYDVSSGKWLNFLLFLCVKSWNSVKRDVRFSWCQPGFLLAAEQKGFELLELRGEDPRLASLDTLSGENIPLHFLLRLHGYTIQVSGATGKNP